MQLKKYFHSDKLQVDEEDEEGAEDNHPAKKPKLTGVAKNANSKPQNANKKK